MSSPVVTQSAGAIPEKPSSTTKATVDTMCVFFIFLPFQELLAFYGAHCAHQYLSAKSHRFGVMKIHLSVTSSFSHTHKRRINRNSLHNAVNKNCEKLRKTWDGGHKWIIFTAREQV
jgi:hypothetical protein